MGGNERIRREKEWKEERKEGVIKKEETGKRSVMFCVYAIQNVMAT